MKPTMRRLLGVIEGNFGADEDRFFSRFFFLDRATRIVGVRVNNSFILSQMTTKRMMGKACNSIKVMYYVFYNITSFIKVNMSLKDVHNQKDTVLNKEKSLESKGNSAVFYKKAHHLSGRVSRLVAGVYVVLDAVRDHTPSGFADEVADQAREALRHSNALFGVRTQADLRSRIFALLIRLESLKNQLAVMHWSGYVSTMNHDHIEAFLTGVVRELLIEQTALSEVGVRHAEPAQLVHLDPALLSLGHTEHAPASMFSAGDMTTRTTSQSATPHSAKKTPVAPVSAPVRESTTAQQRQIKESRHIRLVGLLARLGTVSMAEIADEFPDVSDKTIQRDLNALIKAGKVIREGKRRWSTYRLA